MVSAITQALLNRTATVRQIVKQAQGDPSPSSAAQIALFDADSASNLDAINKLEAAKVDVKKQAKDLAKQRLERLKEQLRLLKMFGGSSKAIARQAAQLAREIAGAVHAYAGSDGGAVPVDDSRLAFGGGDAQSGGDGAANGDAEAAAATTADAEAAGTDAATPDAATADAATTPNATAVQQPTDSTTARSQAQADRDADRAFYQDAKNLLAQLKRIVEDAQRKAQHKQKHGASNGAADLHDALGTIATVTRQVTQVANQALATPIVPVSIPAASVRISV